MKNSFLYIIFLFYVIYHLISLSFSPLPWLDEDMFHSMARDFALHHTFYCPVATLELDRNQILVYGPVYFLISGMFMKLFGFGMFQFRLVSMISGIIYLLLALKIFHRFFNPTRRIFHLFFFAMLFDPILNSSMHGGRMDTMAGAFILGSVYFFFRLKEERNMNLAVLFTSLSALSASLAVITTPRMGCLVISLSLLMFIRWLSGFSFNRFLQMICWACVFALPILSWICYAFNSADHLLYDLAEAKSFGGNFFWPRERHQYSITQYPLIAAALVFLIIGIIRKGRSFVTEKTVLSLLNIIAFYLIVFEVGGYYVIIIPYFYFLIFEGISDLSPGMNQWIRNGMAYLLIACNLGVFSVKLFTVTTTMNQRDPRGIGSFAKQLIPAGSKVIGDEIMYYAVMNNGSDFQLMNWYSSFDVREKFQREVYDYDYIFVSDIQDHNQPALLEYYAGKATLRKIGTYFIPIDQPRIHIPGSINYFNSYNATLYKRIR